MKKWLYDHRHGWVFIYGIFYCIWFFSLERANFDFKEIRCFIDDYIPQLEVFVIPYMLWFVFVAFTIATFFFTSRTDFYHCVAFLFIGMTLCLAIFTLFPSKFDRGPEFLGQDIFSEIIRYIHRVDTNTNVFPSIHCYNSIGCTIALIKSETFQTNECTSIGRKRINLSIKLGAAILSILICLSTLFIKQHSFLDFVGAVVLSIIMYAFVYMIPWKKNKH